MAYKTNNEKAAEELCKALEIVKPNCYMCKFFRANYRDPFSTGKCTCMVAESIMIDEDGVRKAIGATENAPLFPVIVAWLENEGKREQVEIPGIIATEYGIGFGRVKWPSDFDPIYIVFCVFFEERDKKNDD